MSSFVLIRHKVQDFTTWKAGYDAHHSKRVEAGLTEKYLLRRADNPNEIALFYEEQDVGRAKAFGASADLRAKMQESGVVDKPDVYILKEWKRS